jgi:hypothetical protein
MPLETPGTRIAPAADELTLAFVRDAVTPSRMRPGSVAPDPERCLQMGEQETGAPYAALSQLVQLASGLLLAGPSVPTTPAAITTHARSAKRSSWRTA